MNTWKDQNEKLTSVKLKKLDVPKFNGDPRSFYKWKNIYERYTKNLSNEMKYDYLLASTEGEAKRYVENRLTYEAAIQKLEEKFGNIHMIMGILIDEIKSLPIVRKGDFRTFEQLSLRVNDFHDRLILMGRVDDAENSYVLKEIESKLNNEDVQRWLESCGDNVDFRKVKDLTEWLDRQTHLRRISLHNQGSSNYSQPKGNSYVT